MRKLLLFLIIGTFWLIVGSTVSSAEEASLESITVNVDFQDTDLRRALLFISVDTGLSIIPDDDVMGTVTARFVDQPVLEVLERILEVNDCEYKLVGNIIQVIRIPVVSKILPLKFALAFEVAAAVESLVLLSPKGALQVDEEANSLLISDKRPYMEEIVGFIQELDVPEKQLRSKTFSPEFLKVERLASLIKDQLTDRGKIDIDPSTNSLLITETSFHLTKITSLIESMDTFQPERKVFPLKFALASDMERLIKGYLSPEGTLEVSEERNELTIRDASYYLEKIAPIVADEDRPEKQIREESFPIKYARIEDLALLLKENLSPEGTLGVDEERGLISIEDTSYHLFKLGRLIEQQDSFIPKKKRYRVRFAPLTLLADRAQEMLSDKGTLEIEEDTSSFVVSDVQKNLEKIERLVGEADTLEAQLVPPLVFQDEDLTQALEMLSGATGVNIVVDPGVQGRVNLIFGRPIELVKILPQILEPNDCRYEIIGDTIRVIPIPLIKRILPLRFAAVSEVVSSVEGLLSSRGSLAANEETNSLIVTDKGPYLEEIVGFIQELDVPEKQLRSKTFSPEFLKVERLASLIKDQLTDRGKIDIDPSTNSLLITETSFHLTKITSLIESMDTFQPERKVFPLKFALASDMERLIKGYLSPEGTLEVSEERNELTIRDASYYLEKIAPIVADEDRPEKQIREESFPIKYARIEDLALLLKENLSPEGTLGVDEERGLISIEDTSYHLFKLGRLIEQQDSFIPKKKRYRVRFAPLKSAEEKAKELLSDEGRIVETQETRDYVDLVVSDVEKNLERIGEEIRKIDKLEDWVVTREYTLECYYTPEEVQHRLENVLTKTRDFEGKIIRLPKARYTATRAQEEEEFILIPQEEGPVERETVSERILERQLSRFEGDELLSREKAETEGNVIEVRDLERNVANIEKLIDELNGEDARKEPITKTFYIKEGSLERMALAMASILGISPDDIEGLEPGGEWMQMEVPTLEINLGTVGPR